MLQRDFNVQEVFELSQLLTDMVHKITWRGRGWGRGGGRGGGRVGEGEEGRGEGKE